METALCRAADRSSRASFRACRFMSTIPFRASRSRARFNGSIPTRLSPPSIPAPAHATAAIAPQTCQFGNLGRNALRGPRILLERLLPHKMVSVDRTRKTAIRGSVFQRFQPSEFRAAKQVLAGIPGKPSTQTGFGALTYTTSPPTGLLGVGLGGDSTPRMIAFQARLEF